MPHTRHWLSTCTVLVWPGVRILRLAFSWESLGTLRRVIYPVMLCLPSSREGFKALSRPQVLALGKHELNTHVSKQAWRQVCFQVWAHCAAPRVSEPQSPHLRGQSGHRTQGTGPLGGVRSQGLESPVCCKHSLKSALALGVPHYSPGLSLRRKRPLWKPVTTDSSPGPLCWKR